MIGNKEIKNKGFTLTELLVSVTVFAIAVAAASSLFSAAARAQRKSIETQKVLDNGRYILESVGKTLRMGEIKTATSGSTLQACHPTKGVTDELNCRTAATGYKLVTYALSSNVVTEDGIAISSSNVKVNNLYFNITGVGAGGTQPRVTVVMNIRSLDSTGPMYQVSLDLQTTLSQRNLDTP